MFYYIYIRSHNLFSKFIDLNALRFRHFSLDMFYIGHYYSFHNEIQFYFIQNIYTKKMDSINIDNYTKIWTDAIFRYFSFTTQIYFMLLCAYVTTNNFSSKIAIIKMNT